MRITMKNAPLNAIAAALVKRYPGETDLSDIDPAELRRVMAETVSGLNDFDTKTLAALVVALTSDGVSTPLEIAAIESDRNSN